MTSVTRLAAIAVAVAAFGVSVGVTKLAGQDPLPVPSFGEGDQTCAAWSAATASDARRLQSWVLGYVSGAVMIQASQTGIPILPPMEIVETGPNSFQTRSWDMPGVINWVNRRCARVPNETLNDVAADLARTLTRKSAQQASAN